MSVYFIQQGLNGPIKIGKAKNVWQRLSTLQSANAEVLRVRLTLPGGLAAERKLHERFQKHRITREWFRPADDIEHFIQTRTGPGFNELRLDDLGTPDTNAELRQEQELRDIQRRAEMAEQEGRVICCPVSWDAD